MPSITQEFYVILFLLTVLTHYAGTVAVLNWIVIIKLNLSFSWFCLIWFFLWLSVGLLFHGCPFTYIEEYFAHQAWGTERTYDFTKSMLYLIIFRYF